MKLKPLATRWLPPVFTDTWRRWRHPGEARDPIRFAGDYASWAEASQAASGYAAPEILARTRAALLKVRDGEAAFERDSVVFDHLQLEFPLLAGLLRAAAAEGGRLSVLDFGGALGSSYFQCRGFLSTVRELRWNVVEQPAHVACGRADFANDQLKFHSTIEECLQHEQPNVLLLSGVLQYLPQPYDFLRDALRHGIAHVQVERAPFMRDGRDRLTLQHVPAWIYPAIYPAWFLSETRFRACFAGTHELVCEYPGADQCQPEGGEACFKGFQFQLKPKAGHA